MFRGNIGCRLDFSTPARLSTVPAPDLVRIAKDKRVFSEPVALTVGFASTYGRTDGSFRGLNGNAVRGDPRPRLPPQL